MLLAPVWNSVTVRKSLIERLLVWKWRKASVADVLVAVELHLVGFMQPPSPHVVGAQVAARPDLLFNTEVVLVVIRGLECSCREGIQADSQRTGRLTRLDACTRRAARSEDSLKRLVSADRCVNSASRNPRRYSQASHLPAYTTSESRIIGSVHQTAVGDLLGEDVVEYAESCMDCGMRANLVCKRGAWLVDEQRRGCEEVMNIAQDNLIQRLIGFVRGIQEGSSHARKESLRTGDVGIPGHAHTVGNGCLWRGLVGVHCVVFEVPHRHSFLERDGKVLHCGKCGPVSELRQVVVGNRRHSALAEVIVACVDTAGIDAKVQCVRSTRPGQVVVDLPLRDLTPLWKRIVQAAELGERHAVAARSEHDRVGLERLGVVVRLEDAGIPARSRIELVDEGWAEHMRITHDKGSLRLRRKSVKDRVDRISPFSLQAGILLEAIPDAVFGIDGLIDLQHHEILTVAIVQRPLPLGRAAIAIEQGAIRRVRAADFRRRPADKL